MAKKICALLALILALALLVACNAQPDVVEVTRVVEATRDIDAEAVAIGAAVKDAVKEGIAESQPTPTNTPRPTATATPDGLAAAVATLAASGIEVQLPPPVAATDEGSGALAPTGTVTVPPAPAGDDDTKEPDPASPAAGEGSSTGTTPVFTKTFSLVLPEYYSETIELSGWSPIEMHPNGDWYREFTANDSWDAISQTWKRASAGCSLPGACNVFGPAGVLGADDYAEAKANDSAVWTGSMWHDSPDGNGFDLLCPEGSYCDVYAEKFGSVTIGRPDNPFLHLSIPSCGSHCSQGLTIRNWLARDGVDLNTNIRVEDYGAPSAASWTEYVVPPSAAEYFSQDYMTAQAVNAHERNNNGSGPNDNHLHIQWVLDVNDMSLTAEAHTAVRGWFLVWTNVVAYGDH